LGRDIDAKLAVAALDMALSNRKGTDFSNLIHHSDQGVQYASLEYISRLKEKGIRISMSRRGNPYDNAYAESFFKSFKYEEVYLWEYETFDVAHKNTKKFLEIVYNRKRVHSSLGYVTPEEFEKSEEGLNRKFLNWLSDYWGSLQIFIDCMKWLKKSIIPSRDSCIMIPAL